MLGLILAAAQAAATVSAPVPCEIVATTIDGDQWLIGQCGTNAVMLGRALEYESAVHGPTGAAVAVVRRLGDTRVLLVRSREDGQALLENLTADVARQGGRSSRAGLGDLAVDISRFASDGTITTLPADGEAGRSSTTPVGEVSVQTLIADEQARKALPSVPPPLVQIVADGKGPEARTDDLGGQE